MKTNVMYGALLVLGWSMTAEAQSYSPVVLPAQYVSNYSPYTAAYGTNTPQNSAVQYYQPVPSSGQVHSAQSPITLSPATLSSGQTLHYAGGCGGVPQPQTTFLPPAGRQPTIVYRPAAPVEALPSKYHVGHGIIGQPKLYVTGQHLRNILRFITP